MEVLCMGGPKDGQRIHLSKQLLISGWFEVPVEDKECGPGEGFSTIRYSIRMLSENSKLFYVATTTEVFQVLERLINNYKPGVVQHAQGT